MSQNGCAIDQMKILIPMLNVFRMLIVAVLQVYPPVSDPGSGGGVTDNYRIFKNLVMHVVVEMREGLNKVSC